MQKNIPPPYAPPAYSLYPETSDQQPYVAQPMTHPIGQTPFFNRVRTSVQNLTP